MVPNKNLRSSDFEKKVICVIILCDVKSVLEIFVNGLEVLRLTIRSTERLCLTGGLQCVVGCGPARNLHVLELGNRQWSIKTFFVKGDERMLLAEQSFKALKATLVNRSIALCLICYRLPNHLVYIKGCDRMAILHNGWKSSKISFSREKFLMSKS